MTPDPAVRLTLYEGFSRKCKYSFFDVKIWISFTLYKRLELIIFLTSKHWYVISMKFNSVTFEIVAWLLYNYVHIFCNWNNVYLRVFVHKKISKKFQYYFEMRDCGYDELYLKRSIWFWGIGMDWELVRRHTVERNKVYEPLALLTLCLLWPCLLDHHRRSG